MFYRWQGLWPNYVCVIYVWFDVTTGVRKGYTLSPLVFDIVLNSILKSALKKTQGLQWTLATCHWSGVYGWYLPINTIRQWHEKDVRKTKQRSQSVWSWNQHQKPNLWGWTDIYAHHLTFLERLCRMSRSSQYYK